jgi:hypothetical protein
MATNSISLCLVNQSADTNNSSIVVFQRNVATNFDEYAVAWKVIQDLGIGWTHKLSTTSTCR